MSKPYSVHVECDAGGYFCEWYTDDDGASGYGDNPLVTRWYGSRQECEEMAKHNPPKECNLVRPSYTDDRSPGSALWCETYGDNH